MEAKSDNAIHDLWFTNMLLLGFNVEEEGEKYNLAFSARMFFTPNKKGMEVVLRFIMMRVNPAATKKKLRNLWPIIDKVQAKEFKKVVIETVQGWDWDSSVQSSMFRISQMQSAHGERLYHLLFNMSNHALKVVLQREHPEYQLPIFPNLDASAGLHHTVFLATKLRMIQQANEFVVLAEKQVKLQSEWDAFATELSTQYREAALELANAKEELASLNGYATRTASDRNEGVEKAKDVLRRVERLQQATARHNETTRRVVTGGSAVPRVDGNALLVRFSGADDSLKPTVTADGRLDVPALVNQFCDATEAQIHAALRGGASIRGLGQHVEEMQRRGDSHRMLERAACTLSNEVFSMLSEVEDAVAQLQSRSGLQRAPAPASQRREMLELIPPTPKMSFSPAPTPMKRQGMGAGMVAATPAPHERNKDMDRVAQSVARHARHNVNVRRMPDLDGSTEGREGAANMHDVGHNGTQEDGARGNRDDRSEAGRTEEENEGEKREAKNSGDSGSEGRRESQRDGFSPARTADNAALSSLADRLAESMAEGAFGTPTASRPGLRDLFWEESPQRAVVATNAARLDQALSFMFEGEGIGSEGTVEVEDASGEAHAEARASGALGGHTSAFTQRPRPSFDSGSVGGSGAGGSGAGGGGLYASLRKEEDRQQAQAAQAQAAGPERGVPHPLYSSLAKHGHGDGAGAYDSGYVGYGGYGGNGAGYGGNGAGYGGHGAEYGRNGAGYGAGADSGAAWAGFRSGGSFDLLHVPDAEFDALLFPPSPALPSSQQARTAEGTAGGSGGGGGQEGDAQTQRAAGVLPSPAGAEDSALAWVPSGGGDSHDWLAGSVGPDHPDLAPASPGVSMIGGKGPQRDWAQSVRRGPFGT